MLRKRLYKDAQILSLTKDVCKEPFKDIAGEVLISAVLEVFLNCDERSFYKAFCVAENAGQEPEVSDL